MKAFKCLLSCALALLLPAAALAEGRATATLAFEDGWVLQGGAPFLVPQPSFDWSYSYGAAVTRLRGELVVNFSDPSYGDWGASTCSGACANFPPDDTHVGPGGYVNASISGYMAMGGNDPAMSWARADAAATGHGANDAQASGTYQFDLQPQASGAFSLVFGVRPYLDLYLAPGSPAGSEAFASTGVHVEVFDVTAGQSLLVVDRVFSHRLTKLAPDSAYIEDPGIVPFDIALGTLQAGNAYELRINESAYASVALAVPEPGTGGLLVVGGAIVAACVRRHHRQAAHPGRNG